MKPQKKPHNVRLKNGRFAPIKKKKKSEESPEKLQKAAEEERRRKTLSLFENNRNLFLGRQIVEMKKLAEDLWCEDCDICLSLKNAIAAKQDGAVQTFDVICQQCDKIKLVSTGTYDCDKLSYETNLKLKSGFLDSGMKPTQLDALLSAMEIPAVFAEMIAQDRNEEAANPPKKKTRKRPL